MLDYEEIPMRLAIALSLLTLVACGRPAEDESASKLTAYVQQSPHKDYPQFPESAMTPGALCDHADEYRYPEHIAYCRRSVSTALKRDIIKTYDEEFNYAIENMPRGQFKIDHYVPLCMGGANSQNNLWPQHESVYTITDPMEGRFCELLAKAQIKQSEAIAQIKYAKLHLEEVPGIVKQLDDMLGH